jgi:hypothetical protein
MSVTLLPAVIRLPWLVRSLSLPALVAWMVTLPPAAVRLVWVLWL